MVNTMFDHSITKIIFLILQQDQPSRKFSLLSVFLNLICMADDSDDGKDDATATSKRLHEIFQVHGAENAKKFRRFAPIQSLIKSTKLLTITEQI
uniref:Uncharacterized protein n=1 Tax=Romanomermis culicivorax TaxID=13658 RepID=A0A915JFL3_ROMCU